MTLTTVFNRSLLTVTALLSVSVATQAVAFPQLAQKGSHGGSQIVRESNTKRLVTRGPNGAGFITEKTGFHGGSRIVRERKAPKTTNRIITRGPNGAGFITNR